MIAKLAKITTHSLLSPFLLPSRIIWHAPRFGFAFFKNSHRSKDFVITQSIKRCLTSEQVMNIITKHDRQLNIVHLTAILDRIEEQNMLSIDKIVEYVVQRLSSEGEFFRRASGEDIRTVCNIVCYLGNLKNKELNHIFANLNYPLLLNNPKTLETTMLITGLIRLDLFKQVFGLQTQQSKKKILLEEIIGESYTRNQILSIWYAYASQISKQNQALNNHLNMLLARVKQGGLFDLRTYTYALVCYVFCSHTFRDPASGPLYKLIRDEIPFVSKEKLLPYQFSLLLQNINNLKRQRSLLDSKTNAAKDAVVFPQEFIELLMSQFENLSKRKNVTLRNISNSLKEFREAFGIKLPFLLTATQKVVSILNEEIVFAEKSQSYHIDFKVDLLSLSSLMWKVGQSFQEFKPTADSQALLKKFAEATVKYLKLLKTKNMLDKFTIKEILMIYSGLVLIKQQKAVDLDQQFTKLTSDLVASHQRKYTVKEVTLLLTYLKKTKIVSTSLCDYFKATLSNLQKTQEFASNPTAKQYMKSKCILGAGSLCLHCFSCFE